MFGLVLAICLGFSQDANTLNALRPDKPCAIDIWGVHDAMDVLELYLPDGFWTALADHSYQTCRKELFYEFRTCWDDSSRWVSARQVARLLECSDAPSYDPCVCVGGEEWTWGFQVYHIVEGEAQECDPVWPGGEFEWAKPRIVNGGVPTITSTEDQFSECELLAVPDCEDWECQCHVCGQVGW